VPAVRWIGRRDEKARVSKTASKVGSSRELNLEREKSILPERSRRFEVYPTEKGY
jgi:hypothetical protein